MAPTVPMGTRATRHIPPAVLVAAHRPVAGMVVKVVVHGNVVVPQALRALEAQQEAGLDKATAEVVTMSELPAAAVPTAQTVVKAAPVAVGKVPGAW